MTRSRAVLIVLVSALVAFTMIANRFIPGCAEQKHLVDLPMFHAASRAVAAGDNPYDVQRLALYESDAPDSKVQPFPYTPVITALFKPLASVHLDTLQPIWMIVSCLGMGILALLSMKIVGVQSLVIAAALIVVMPIQIALVNGQLEAFLAPLLTLAWMLSQNKRSVTAGLLLGFVIIVKHAIAPFLLLFVIERKWNVVMWSVVGGLVTALATLPFIGIQPWMQWLSFTSGFGAAGGSAGLNVSMPYNLSLVGLLSSWGMNSANAMRFAAPILLVGATSWLFVQWNRCVNKSPLFLFGALALLAPFCMPYFWPHHQLYAMPAFLGLVVVAWKSSKGRGLAIGGILIVAIQTAPALLPHRILHKAGIMTNTYGLRLVSSTLMAVCILLLMLSSLNYIRFDREKAT